MGENRVHFKMTQYMLVKPPPAAGEPEAKGRLLYLLHDFLSFSRKASFQSILSS